MAVDGNGSVLFPVLQLSHAVVCTANEHSACCSQDLSDHLTGMEPGELVITMGHLWQ